jgi:hypothetical protein
MSEPTNTETPQVPETVAPEDTVSFPPTYTNTYIVPLYFNSMIDIYCPVLTINDTLFLSLDS